MGRLVFIGLSITSSWGNGHATTYRGLIRALARRGHEVLFLERDAPWYAANRDLPEPPYCRTILYRDLDDLQERGDKAVREADAVIVGSYVSDGIEVGRWAIERASGPVAFYDIDTPVTLAKLDAGTADYIDDALVHDYDLYLSFSGGPTLRRLEAMGSPRAAALYCSVDSHVHGPVIVEPSWRLGYLGTYSADRQPLLSALLLEPATRLGASAFVVAGPQYPPGIEWPVNVRHIEHLPPGEHAAFYCAQDFTLNITRADMKAAGHSPSVRLFEAAACGVPVITDPWPGLEEFFRAGDQILVAEAADDVVAILERVSPEKRRALATAARSAVLARHTCDHRAAELEALLQTSARNRRRDQRLIPGHLLSGNAGQAAPLVKAPTGDA
ncbi:MAG TPA: glycosyltransferase [Stellaceae bacterium]|jgi:spore maturation protein CgeB|nr:glycosyltransferase [Stellaceae bacterium]